MGLTIHSTFRARTANGITRIGARWGGTSRQDQSQCHQANESSELLHSEFHQKGIEGKAFGTLLPRRSGERLTIAAI